MGGVFFAASRFPSYFFMGFRVLSSLMAFLFFSSSDGSILPFAFLVRFFIRILDIGIFGSVSILFLGLILCSSSIFLTTCRLVGVFLQFSYLYDWCFSFILNSLASVCSYLPAYGTAPLGRRGNIVYPWLLISSICTYEYFTSCPHLFS